jgi:hypothetical protein
MTNKYPYKETLDSLKLKLFIYGTLNTKAVILHQKKTWQGRCKKY